MIMEGRKNDLLQVEPQRTILEKYETKLLSGLLINSRLEGRIEVTDAQVRQEIDSQAGLDETRARAILQRRQAAAVFDEYYASVYPKYEVNKKTENFGKAAETHQRLLNNPLQPRTIHFIKAVQVREQLSQDEKDLVLASYKGGVLTLKDWFEFLCDMSPPSRPKDLGTARGVENLLDRAIKAPILAAEARFLGFDKDPEFLSRLNQRRESMLLSAVRQERLNEIAEPTAEQIKAYFEEHPEEFARGGKPPAFSPDLENRVKMHMWQQRKKAELEEYHRQLLKKYSYEINRPALRRLGKTLLGSADEPPAD
jgi:hypothetical protein